MASEKLTALKVSRARGPGLLNDGKGLYLRIAAGGSRSWVLRFMLAGRAREMGLGSLVDVSLAEAREFGRESRKLCKQGSTRSKLVARGVWRSGSSAPRQ
jgi:hypothetical protein